ncbi:MAG TPA: hypothetical protein VGI40_20715 [Pirellulaceae bacterium]
MSHIRPHPGQPTDNHTAAAGSTTTGNPAISRQPPRDPRVRISVPTASSPT